MPGIVANGVHGEEAPMIGNTSTSKDTSTPIKSSRSSFSPQTQIRQSGGQSFPIEGMADTSIERLQENSCDMQSSGQSSSRRSGVDEFTSDSELHQLDDTQMREVEIVKEKVEKKTRGDSSSEASSRKGSFSNDKKLDKVGEIQSSTASSVSSEESDKASSCSEASSKSRTTKAKSSPAKPPIDKKNDGPLRKQNTGLTRVRKPKYSSVGRSVSQGRIDISFEPSLDKSGMGTVLLKQARDLISLGDNPHKALESALQATRVFEKAANGKPSLELVMCLHVTAAIYCCLGNYNKAIPVIERSIEIPVIEEGQQHAIAKFTGHMQLGDIYAMLGQLEKSIMCYTSGLEIQRQVLGETDPKVGETCRYVAEASFQALQFDEAERLCQMALNIHRENGSSSSLEEAADRRLMGLICEANGDHEAALEHLVLASLAMVENGQEVEVASVDCNIGDTYLSLARYDEAIFAYQRALTVFKAHKGENHPAVGSVLVRLADLYNRTWKMRESKTNCESALKIYENPMNGVPLEEIASGLMNVSAIYESMNELEKALELLHKALEIYKSFPCQKSTIAGVEAQMGVLYYMLGNYTESYNAFKNAVSKLRAIGEKKSAFFGFLLNQMGLACVQICSFSEAAELFEEAKVIFEQEHGPYHLETLGVYSNLAGAYDASGRPDEAIEILEYIVGMREEKLGTANPDVVDEKRRLNELLKETGRVRSRKMKSLENLLNANPRTLNNIFNMAS